MNRRMFMLLCHVMVMLSVLAAGDTTGVVYTVAKMQVDYLPQLHLPRSGHRAMYAGNDLVVMGGHTDGFVPTPTAEYLAGNTWHMVKMVYSHDFGMALKLRSGEVLLAGGVEQELGVGQTYGIENYIPATHSFRGYASMNQKRAKQNGAEISGGRVVIAGNWHRADYIECFDGKMKSDSVKPVSHPRAYPIMLRTSPDDVMILGAVDNLGNWKPCPTVDRLNSDPIEVPLLQQWMPYSITRAMPNSDECSIGDESQGEYCYLLPVINQDGQMAMMRVRNTVFALLPTACPIPMRSPWSKIAYVDFVIDRKVGRAYLVGCGDDTRLYVTAVDYAQADNSKEAPITLYYSEPVTHIWKEFAVALTPEGDIVIVGGNKGNNYEPLALVARLHVTPQAAAPSGWKVMFWVALVLIAALVAIVLWGGKREKENEKDEREQEPQERPDNKQLMRRITELLEQQQLYLQSDLKLQDVATTLGVSSVKVSRCIKAEGHTSFIQLVNRYRVEHAQKMMLNDPDAKLTTIAMASGFANDTSFYRTFKAITSLSPKEWINLN